MLTLTFINSNSAGSKSLNGTEFSNQQEFVDFCEKDGNSVSLISNQEYARRRGYSDFASLLVDEDEGDEPFLEAYKKSNGLVIVYSTPTDEEYDAPSESDLEVTNHIYNNRALSKDFVVSWHLSRLAEIHGGSVRLEA